MELADSVTASAFLSDKQYNFAKFLTVVLLPAIGTLYFALATIWGLPAGQEVLGTIVAIEAFLGVILGVSSKQYEDSGAKYSGEINVTKTPDKTLYSLDLAHAPEVLEEKKEAIFKVNPTVEPPSQ
jgi:hypothetical protein